MILRKAIDEYLDRPRDNHNWVKTLPENILDEEIKKLNYELTTPLMIHQKACFLLGSVFPQFVFQLDMGTGKTLLVLELLSYYFSTKKICKVVVVCPTKEVAEGWENEILQWRVKLPYLLLLGSGAQKWEYYDEFSEGLIICTYPGLVWMLSTKENIKGKNKLLPNTKLIDKFVKGVDGLILDESTKIMNRDSLAFRVCNQISKYSSIHYALVGRALGRDPIALWAQYFLIDRGDTLSSTLGFFREVFFEKKKSYFGGPYSFEYKFDKRMDGDLSRIMSHRSIRYSSNECFELPELVSVIKEVRFTEDIEKYYKDIVQE